MQYAEVVYAPKLYETVIFANKMGVHWYFHFVVKMGSNRDVLSKCTTFKEMLPSIIKPLIVLNVIY